MYGLHQDAVDWPKEYQEYRGPTVLPRNRGDILAALSSEAAMCDIYPTTPRPYLHLRDTRFSAELTAADLALLELFITVGRRDMFERPDYTVSVRDVLRFMKWERNPKYLDASIDRLRIGTYRVCRRIKGVWTDKGARLIFTSLMIEVDQRGARVITFRLVAELVALQRCLQSYGYIEVAALPLMKSRWSQAVYKQLMTRTWKRWLNLRVNGGGFVLWRLEPNELAQMIGWSKPRSPFKLSVFKREVVIRLAKDFAHLRNHRVSISIDKTDCIVFEIQPVVVHWRSLKIPQSAAPGVLREHDLPELQVPATFFMRVGRYFGIEPTTLYQMWQLALAESHSGEALDRGYSNAPFRGKALLKAIDDLGSVEACWRMILSELKDASIAQYCLDQSLIRQSIDDRNRRAVSPESTLSVDVKSEIAKAVRRRRIPLTALAKDIRGELQDRDRSVSDYMKSWRKAELDEEDYTSYIGEDEAIRERIESVSNLSYEEYLDSHVERVDDEMPAGDNYRAMIAEVEHDLAELPY